MKIRFYGLITTLFLFGCSMNDLKPQLESREQPPVYTDGEFNRESIYDLLVAEMAGHQRNFELALGNYLKQARLTNDPGVAKRATRVAQYLRNVDAISEAATLWRSADPANPEPYQISASILLHQKRYEEALPLLKRALEYDRPRILAMIRSQINAMPNNVVAGYQRVIKELLDAHPLQPDLFITQGLLYSKQARQVDAFASFDEALKIDPKNHDAITQKTELLRSTGQYQEALATVKPALKTASDNQQLHILYTQLLFQSKQYEAGVKEAKALLEQHPKDYQLKFYLALVMLENGREVDAKPVFEALLEQKPNDSRPHFYLGAIAQQEGKIEHAIEHLLKVDDPTTTYQAITRISTLLDSPDDLDRLSRVITDVRNTRPDLAPQLYGIEAEWLNLHGFDEAALVLLEEALTRFNDNVNLLYTRAMLLEATDFNRAEKDLRHILELEPNSSLALNALGYTLTVHTSRYDEALTLISQALEIRPDDPAVIDSMGWVLYKLERYEESVQYLKRAYAAIPDAEVAGHLIQAYWAHGNKEQALDLLRAGLEKDPDSIHLQDAAQAVEAQ